MLKLKELFFFLGLVTFASVQIGNKSLLPPHLILSPNNYRKVKRILFELESTRSFIAKEMEINEERKRMTLINPDISKNQFCEKQSQHLKKNEPEGEKTESTCVHAGEPIRLSFLGMILPLYPKTNCSDMKNLTIYLYLIPHGGIM